jgi:hypothetical protein
LGRFVVRFLGKRLLAVSIDISQAQTRRGFGMPRIGFSLIVPIAVVMLCSSIPIFAGARADQNAGQGSKQSAPPPAYLPPTASGARLLCVILADLGEPSLFEASKDPGLVSYRVSYFSTDPVHETAVRIVVNSDGIGEITSAVSSGNPRVIKKTKNAILTAEVHHFLQLVENAGFWSADRSSPDPNAKGSSEHRYLLEGSWWMLEGARNGSFHYEYRRNPAPSSLTEIGCYLAKDLAKPDGQEIPMAGCASRGPSN